IVLRRHRGRIDRLARREPFREVRADGEDLGRLLGGIAQEVGRRLDAALELGFVAISPWRRGPGRCREWLPPAVPPRQRMVTTPPMSVGVPGTIWTEESDPAESLAVTTTPARGSPSVSLLAKSTPISKVSAGVLSTQPAGLPCRTGKSRRRPGTGNNVTSPCGNSSAVARIWATGVTLAGNRRSVCRVPAPAATATTPAARPMAGVRAADTWAVATK